MIYNGYFRQRNTDTLYTVRLTTNNGTTAKEITLGGSPFVTEMDTSDDIIYEPVKYQTATVEVVTEDYMFDVYSSKAQDTKVELISNNEVQWVGYVRPNLYDMGFEKRRECVEIECADALSTLQYIPYRTTERKTRSFLYLINKLLKSCNAYKGFYISDNIQLDSATATASIIDKLYISESNFFDEKDENDTDDDVAWKCNEVLEEICRYLGVTAISDKDYVWFLDYDALKNGNSYYYYYSIDGGNGTRIQMNFTKGIVGKDYSANGATISLDNVYNKITVKADLNDYDSIIPSLYDNLINITSDTDEYVTKQTKKKRGEIVKSTIGDSGNNNMIVLVDESEDGKYDLVAAKYFNNANYKLFKYKNGVDVTDSITSLSYSDTKTMHGATIAKFYSKELSNTMWERIIYGERDLDTLLADNDVNTISLSKYLLLTNPKDDYYISNDDTEKYPYVQTTVSDLSALYGGDNTYFLISGTYRFSAFSHLPFPYNGNIDLYRGKRYMKEGETYLVCKLQWGDLYWNGSEWTSTNSTFKLPYMKADASDDERRADETMFKDLDIRNTVSWRIGTSEKGYCIKAPTTKLLYSVPILTLYKPHDPAYNKETYRYPHLVVLLKDFDIKAVIGDPTYSDNSDSDTEYSAIIDSDYTQDLSDIEFKINTWDNKKPNYSAVAYYNDGYHFLNKTYNKALADEVNGMSYINENNITAVTDGSLRQEWWLVYKVYKQYSTPSTIVKMNARNDVEIYGTYSVHNLDGKTFILDSINRDYQNNSSEIKLIEKK